jgi:outer membrane protein OmpA-like peptidoglycan-associated protein
VPDFRGLFQFAYPSPRKALAPEDSDGDGLRDDRDKCPTVREDRDGFRDDDGCIDADNDGDGMSDARDKCPDEAEDRDETEDDDGCIDADNDKDGIADAQDECPNATEDLDGFEDANGCPDLDNDGDALTDLRDQCPEEPEDGDGFADEDGCPDPDNDKDKVADLEDKCPTVPGPASSKGCPSAVRVDRAQIRILQRIEFPTRGAKIRPESLVVIDQVRSVLEVNPQIRRVRIEGHTDDRGATARNAKLSQKRAEAVMQYLVRSGVHPGRLEAKGWGEERPLVKNDTPANMQINRRVEFHIVDPAPPQGTVPATP